MGYRKQLSLTLLGAALAALPAVPTLAETLVYKGVNKWVAQEDNAPLQKLMQEARGGKTVFKVKLPKEDRELAVVRLEIVMRILEREAKKAVVMEEVGTARAGSIVID